MITIAETSSCELLPRSKFEFSESSVHNPPGSRLWAATVRPRITGPVYRFLDLCMIQIPEFRKQVWCTTPPPENRQMTENWPRRAGLECGNFSGPWLSLIPRRDFKNCHDRFKSQKWAKSSKFGTPENRPKFQNSYPGSCYSSRLSDSSYHAVFEASPRIKSCLSPSELHSSSNEVPSVVQSPTQRDMHWQGNYCHRRNHIRAITWY